MATPNDLSISIGFEGAGNIIRDAKNVGNAIESISKQAVESAEKIEQSAEQNATSLRTQIKLAKQAAFAASEQYGEQSTQALEAAKKVAVLMDKQEDLNRTVKQLNPDKFAALGTLLKGGAQGVSGLVSGMQLLGGESAATQAALIKVQAAANFANSIQAMSDLSKEIKGAVGNLVGPLVNAFKTMGAAGRVAVASTGIGLLAIGVYELYKAFSGVSEATKKAKEQQEKLNEITKKSLEQSAAKAGGLRAEKTELNLLVPKLNDANISSEERKNVISRINKITPELLKGLDTQNISEGVLETRLAAANAEFDKRIIAIQKEAKAMALRETLQELYKQQLLLEPKILQDIAIANDRAEQKRLGMLGQTTAVNDSAVAGLNAMLDALDPAATAIRKQNEELSTLAGNSEWKGLQNQIDQIAKSLSSVDGLNLEIKPSDAAKKIDEMAAAELAFRDAMALTIEAMQMRSDALDRTLQKEKDLQVDIIVNVPDAIDPFKAPIDDAEMDRATAAYARSNEELDKMVANSTEAISKAENLREAFKELGKNIRDHAIQTIGTFAESLGYAASGMGDFKTAFKDMLKGILPEVLKMAGIALITMAPQAGFPVGLGLLAAGLLLLGLSGLTKGLIEGGGKKGKGGDLDRPNLGSPSGGGGPTPQASGLGDFNTADFGMQIETLTVVVDGGGFQKTILNVIETNNVKRGR